LVRILAWTRSQRFQTSEFCIVTVFEATGLILALLCLCVFVSSSGRTPADHAHDRY
jgi:hypothetical protein